MCNKICDDSIVRVGRCCCFRVMGQTIRGTRCSGVILSLRHVVLWRGLPSTSEVPQLRICFVLVYVKFSASLRFGVYLHFMHTFHSSHSAANQQFLSCSADICTALKAEGLPLELCNIRIANIVALKTDIENKVKVLLITVLPY